MRKMPTPAQQQDVSYHLYWMYAHTTMYNDLYRYITDTSRYDIC